MPAIWTAPVTWNVNQLVTAGDLNQQLRDNLEWLKTPPMASVILDQGADYTTTNTGAFTAVDATVLSLTLSVVSGNVLVGFHGTVEITGGNVAKLDVIRIGVGAVTGEDGMLSFRRVTSGSVYSVSFVRLLTGIPAGNQTFRLGWRVSGGTATLYAGAGTTDFNIHPQFWVREV